MDFFSRHSTDREVAIMMLMAYLSYMLAEVRFFSVNKHYELNLYYIIDVGD